MRVQLYSAAPNPFNPATTIRFDLPQAQNVLLNVYSIDGRWVATLAEGGWPPGSHEVVWAGRDAGGRVVASGAYVYRLEAGGVSVQRVMTLVK